MQHIDGVLMDSQPLDVGLHERRRARRMEDPEYLEAYERAAREIVQTDAVIRAQRRSLSRSRSRRGSASTPDTSAS